MRIYGLKNCDTCRKALKSLPQATLVDVRESPIPAEVIAAALEAFGAELVNTRSATWRTMDDADRAMPVLDMLRAYPAVMKRPLIVGDAGMRLGWSAETRAALGVA